MKKMVNTNIKKIIWRTLSLLKISIIQTFPRHSVRFGKEYFKNRKITAVEIGTYKGVNAKEIIKNLNIKTIYLIDPYDNYEKIYQNEMSLIKKEARKRLKKYIKRIIWIEKFSDDAIKDIPDEIDFIYIDGNHEYEYVKKDMENYWKKVKKRGIMAGHDIASFPGVGKAFVEFCYENKLTPHITRTDWRVVK
jgi:hypothetical protein